MTRHMNELADALIRGIENVESDLESVGADCRRFEIERDEALAKLDDLKEYVKELEDELAKFQEQYGEAA